MKNRFSGPMGSMIKRHLNLRRSLGSVLKNAEYCLDAFDQYLAKYFPDIQTIRRDMIVGYLETTRHLHSTSRCDQLTQLRQFCRFLFQLNPDTYIPEKNLLPHGKVKLKPHIYSKTEIQKLIQLSKKLPPPGSLRPQTYAVLIGLLCVTGLRISEALGLNLEDVDLCNGLLYIRQTKFFKSRIVPITKSTAEALNRYRNKREEFGHDISSSAAFFINERARRCKSDTVQETFRYLTKQTGMKTLQGGYPRLHDFRHSFATRWLAEIYQSGKDPNAYLPVLSTYLGHSNIANTQVYLHTSLDLLRNVGEKFRQHIHSNRNKEVHGDEIQNTSKIYSTVF